MTVSNRRPLVRSKSFAWRLADIHLESQLSNVKEKGPHLRALSAQTCLDCRGAKDPQTPQTASRHVTFGDGNQGLSWGKNHDVLKSDFNDAQQSIKNQMFGNPLQPAALRFFNPHHPLLKAIENPSHLKTWNCKYIWLLGHWVTSD